jgi:hypothetical protein
MTRAGPLPGQGSGPFEVSFPSRKDKPNSPIQTPAQEIPRVVQFRARSTRPARPGRIVIHISARDSRGVIGRSRAFRLTQDDLGELIADAMRREQRA